MPTASRGRPVRSSVEAVRPKAEDVAAGPAGPAAEAPRCQSCATGRLMRDAVKTALWSGERLIVVEDIPALVCPHCGERFYEDETAMRLDMMRGGGFAPDRAARQMTVPVFSFAAPGKAEDGDADAG